MDEQAIRFRLGIFVLAALILLAVLITLFGGFPNYFKRSDLYTLQFANAQGVTPGTPVRRSGVRIGEVRKVALDNDSGKVLVVIQVEDGYNLRKGDRPTLIQGLLAGDTSIAFLPPDDEKLVDATPVPLGATLTGFAQADAGALLQKTSDLVPEAKDALAEVKKAFQKIDGFMTRVDDTAKKIGDVAEGIKNAGPELRKTNKNIDDLVTDVRTIISDAKPTLKEIESMAKEARKIIDKTGPTLDEYHALAKDARKVMDKTGPAIDEYQALAKDSRAILNELKPSIKTFEKHAAEVEKVVPTIRPLIDDTNAAIKTWGRVGERVEVLIKTNEDRINKIADNLNKSVQSIVDLLTEDNRRLLEQTLRNVKRASDKFEDITKNTNDLMVDGKQALKRISESLNKAEDFFDNIQKASKPFADKSPAILANLEQGTANLNRTLLDLRELLQTVGRSDGTVQKLLTDPGLYNNLNDSALMVTKILPRLDRILRDVEIFADKIARHPESLGISGVVRPSAGLKEAPSYPWRWIPQ